MDLNSFNFISGFDESIGSLISSNLTNNTYNHLNPLLINETVIYNETTPYSLKAPFHFFVINQFFMGCISLIIWIIKLLLEKLLNIPKAAILGHQLRHGRSKLSHLIGFILMKLDNCMVFGSLNHSNRIYIILWLSGISFIELCHRYYSILSFDIIPSHATQIITYLFVLFVPIFALWCLKESIHGLKVISVILSFIGIYIYFFTGPTGGIDQFKLNTVFPRYFAAIQTLSSGFLLALYLVLYSTCNPYGSISFIVASQGIGSSLIGIILCMITNIYNHEYPFPMNSSDILYILKSSILTGSVYISIAISLRWGQPTGVSTAILIAPILTGILKHKGNIQYSFDLAHLYGLFFVIIGFMLDMLCQYFIMTKNRKNYHSKILKYQNQDDQESTALLQSQHISL